MATLQNDKTDQLKISPLLLPHWRSLTVALFAVIGVAVTDIPEPWPLKIVFDYIMRSKPLPDWLRAILLATFGDGKLTWLNLAALGVVIIATLGAVSSYLENYLTTSVGQWVTHDLRRILYSHIQRLSLAYHDQKRTGDVISYITSDINAIQAFISSGLLGSLINVLTLVGMMGVMFYLNWRFTLIALSIAPILFLVIYHFTRRIKEASREVRKTEGAVVSVVEEVFSSIRVVKAFAREDYEQHRFEQESLENVEVALHARSIKATLAPLVEVIVACGTSLVLW